MGFVFNVVIACLATIGIYQCFALLQKKLATPLLNPMLLTIISIGTLLILLDIDYQRYQRASHPLSILLELSVVTLGFPLYQHLEMIKKQWKKIVIISLLASILAMISGYMLTFYFTQNDGLAVAIALKSITTPIALILSEKLNGNVAITAIAIVIAGLCGAIFGVKWLNQLGVRQPEAQGLAIGTASHALGTATISQISYQHAAFSSLALILSATLTAFISPVLIPWLRQMMIWLY
ncbi:LrgB family protein [Thalassotalea ganghwensis]